ncbi:unnamed protein product [Meganyctiphanes norvegica]|uniref:RRM domain-containing protein n=1 Tax=Meganyctiphanes norvegica TaxID=48144 RepID=A0AAV2PWJ1_MEGNR
MDDDMYMSQEAMDQEYTADNGDVEAMKTDDGMEPEHLRKVFIANMNLASTEEDLKKYFSKFGIVLDTNILRQTARGGRDKQSRGWGFVTFNMAECVDKVQGARPHTIDGRQVDTKRVPRKDQRDTPESRMQVKHLAVSGFSSFVSGDDLRAVFEQFGIVNSVMLMTSKDKCGAIIEFDDCDTVDKITLQEEIEVGNNLVEFKKIRPGDIHKAFSQDSDNDEGNDAVNESLVNQIKAKHGGKEPEQYRKLFVGNINYSTSEERLKEYFGKFGDVINAFIMTDHKTKEPRGFGYITFTKSSCVDEVQKTRPHSLDDRVLTTGRANPKDKKDKPESSMKATKLFVGCRSFGNVTEEDLTKIFSQFGKVKACNIPKVGGKNRNYGFIEFVDSDSVDKACLFESEIELNGKPVNLNKKPDENKCTKLFVGSRSFANIKEEDIRECFSQFGKVVACNIPKMKDGSNRNFGFVEFENGEAADKAAKQSEKLDIKGNTLNINKKPDGDKSQAQQRGGMEMGGQRGWEDERLRYDDGWGQRDPYGREAWGPRDPYAMEFEREREMRARYGRYDDMGPARRPGPEDYPPRAMGIGAMRREPMMSNTRASPYSRGYYGGY